MENDPNLFNKEKSEKSETLPVVEEKLKIDKKIIETGNLRLVKKVHEEEIEVNTSLVQETITVEHVPVDKFVESIPEVRQEGNITIYPVLQEVLVKKLLLVEEVHVTRHRSEKPAPQKVTLRKEEVQVGRQGDIRIESKGNPPEDPA